MSYYAYFYVYLHPRKPALVSVSGKATDIKCRNSEVLEIIYCNEKEFMKFLMLMKLVYSNVN